MSSYHTIVEYNKKGNYWIDAIIDGEAIKNNSAELLIAGKVESLPFTPKILKGEDHSQTCFMDFIRLKAIPKHPACHWIHHIPNGGKRTPKEGARMKRLGVKKGVPDIFWPYKGINGESGIYLEFKEMGQQQSDEQREFESFCKNQGYIYKVVFGPVEAVHEIEKYCNIKFT